MLMYLFIVLCIGYIVYYFLLGNNKNKKMSVKCSDPEAVCIIQEPHDWEDDASVLIKVYSH